MKKIILLLLITSAVTNAHFGEGLSTLFQSLTACFHKEEKKIYQPIGDRSNFYSSAEQEYSFKRRLFCLLLCCRFFK